MYVFRFKLCDNGVFGVAIETPRPAVLNDEGFKPVLW